MDSALVSLTSPLAALDTVSAAPNVAGFLVDPVQQSGRTLIVRAEAPAMGLTDNLAIVSTPLRLSAPVPNTDATWRSGENEGLSESPVNSHLNVTALLSAFRVPAPFSSTDAALRPGASEGLCESPENSHSCPSPVALGGGSDRAAGPGDSRHCWRCLPRPLRRALPLLARR